MAIAHLDYSIHGIERREDDENWQEHLQDAVQHVVFRLYVSEAEDGDAGVIVRSDESLFELRLKHVEAVVNAAAVSVGKPESEV